VGHKALFLSDESCGDEIDGFSDLFVWDPPFVVGLDDLIGSTDSAHDFEAMRVPPLPKVNYPIGSSGLFFILFYFFSFLKFCLLGC
jgi:hypothetical protein